jgi:hypothetical protein
MKRVVWGLGLGLAGALLAALLGGTAWGAECTGPGGTGPSRCLFRSPVPAAGLVADCESDARCRVGTYAGGPDRAQWFPVPRGLAALPRPEVLWHTAFLAEARFGCGAACRVSYFADVRRHRRSPAWWQVLGVDTRRLLVAVDEDRRLVVRQLFAGREVLRLERPWAPGAPLAEAVTALRFDPDGRLVFTWLRGAERVPVSERLSVPSSPR